MLTIRRRVNALDDVAFPRAVDAILADLGDLASCAQILI